MNDVSGQRVPTSRRLVAAQWAALVVGLAIVAVGEIPRIRAASAGGAPLRWFLDMNVDTSPFLLLFVLLPLCWFVRRPLLQTRWGIGRSIWRRLVGSGEQEQPAGLREWLLALLVGLSSVGVSLWVAERPVGSRGQYDFGELPPAYHDEYSYLFQAETFLAGRVAFPGHADMPQLFDQMHVLNDDGRFASRFFPGTGAWIAPFAAAGHPFWGHWLAGGVTAFFLFWAGRELAGNGVGLLAGLLTAAAPGMALFSNLLLAHHPGLAMLSLFLFAFLRMMRMPRWPWAALAGFGLAYAMLCRPMTAAGFGLPFGLWFAWRLLRPNSTAGTNDTPPPEASPRNRCRLAIAMSLPLVAGFGVLMLYNQATTGNALRTPYQKYTDIYTPRHVYGFNNVLRGERHLGPKVIENYDRWTENLAPRLWERGPDGHLRLSLASRNILNRLQGSLRWSLALVPLAMAGVVFLVGGGWGMDRRWWLVAAAILSLHAVHVPYWYDGIMHYHYVFETGPLWLLLLAGVTRQLVLHWRQVERPLLPLWWGLMIAAALLTTYTAPDPFWSTSRMEAAIDNVAFSRLKYQAFDELTAARVQRPALVLVEADPADRHIDYVTNSPDLSGEILFGRYRPEQTNIEQVRQEFPERTIYLYRAATGELSRVAARD